VKRLAAETRAADVLEAEYAIQLNFGGVNTLEVRHGLGCLPLFICLFFNVLVSYFGVF
jgi:hypothetical protein